MAVVRTQYAVVSASTTVGAAASASIDIPRPADTAETNTIDFVRRPAFRKEFESGRAVIKFDSNLAVAGVLLTKIEVVALNPIPQQAPLDLSFSGFPDPPVVNTSAVLRTILDQTAAPASSIFTLATTDTKTYDLLSTLLVRADEYLRLTVYNSTGAPITGVAECRYDFGLNAANYGSSPLIA